MGKHGSGLYALSIICILFFVFGFLTWANGILVPYFRICLQLSNFQSLWVISAAYMAYFFMAIPSAGIIRRTGYRKAMITGLLVMALGTLLFIPAAATRAYSIFLSGLFITATGLALLQTAANPYVVMAGPGESAARRISFMGIANKLAGVFSQRVLGALFLFNADVVSDSIRLVGEAEKARILDAYVRKVITPYIVITAVLVLLALFIYLSKLPEIGSKDRQPAGAKPRFSGVFQYPYLVLGAVALFFASGCEVIVIDGIILYGTSLGIPMAAARHFTEYTLYATIAGYAVGAVLIPRYISQQRALAGCAIWGIAMALAAFCTGSYTSVYCMIAMGCSNALLWGTIWGLSIRRLGNYTELGAALLIMAISGGATIPLLFGKLIDVYPSHPQHALLLLIPCYLVLLYFALRGYRVNNWNGYTLMKQAGSNV